MLSSACLCSVYSFLLGSLYVHAIAKQCCKRFCSPRCSACHRIIEWLGLEATSRIIKLQPPCCVPGHQSPHLILDQTAQGSIQLALNTSRDRVSHVNAACLPISLLCLPRIPALSQGQVCSDLVLARWGSSWQNSQHFPKQVSCQHREAMAAGRAHVWLCLLSSAGVSSASKTQQPPKSPSFSLPGKSTVSFQCLVFPVPL